MSARIAVGALAAWMLVGAADARAQVFRAQDAPRRGSVEIGGGLLWSGGFDVDSLPAHLTSNDGNTAPPLTLFRTETRVGSVSGVQGRLGFFVSPSVSVELGLKYNRPVAGIRAFEDFEQAPAVTAEQTMTRYIVDGSVLVHPRRWAFRNRRGGPFVIAGVGYLRELHDGNELVETGRTYHGGAGMKYWLTEGRRRLGLRGEALFVVRDGSYGGEDSRRTHPSAGLSLSYLF